MKHEAVIPERINDRVSELLLRHVRGGKRQEELCFGLWRPSTGATRRTSILFDIIPPEPDERRLHGNASFTPEYLTRAVRLACDQKAGLAFMHNHLAPGWQDMSEPDIVAERERISPPARATGYPLLGLTLGTDGSWSGRLWQWNGGKFNRVWCDKVRVAGKRLRITFNDKAIPPPARRSVLQRTIDTWGAGCQNIIARLRVGVVGVGSVGSMVSEALARMGVERLTLIDPDRVEMHNLDRLVHAGIDDVGRAKVDVAAHRLRVSATAERFDIRTYQLPIENETALLSALDCDLLFSAVDRPLPKDLLNRIAYVHCIPVISGGVFVGKKSDGTLGQAAWSVAIVGPSRRCLRCDGQYNSSEVVLERDGSFDDPSYVTNATGREQANQNVFPFCTNLASLMVIEMARLIVAADWWPDVGGKLHYSLIPGRLQHEQGMCQPNCSIRETEALGDTYQYPFVQPADTRQAPTRQTRVGLAKIWRFIRDLYTKVDSPPTIANRPRVE